MPGGNLGPGIVVESVPPSREVGRIDEESGSISVEAGAVASSVDARLRASGRFLPFLPSSARWCSIGGMVANNAAGARSFRFGAAAKWVESLDGILPSGEPFRLSPDRPPPVEFTRLRDRLVPIAAEITSGWPRVRKNSSGYALDRFLPSADAVQLLVGSEGTLGFVTRIELKSAPLPESRGLALLAVDSPDELMVLAAEARRTEASTCEFLGRRLIEMAGLVRDSELGDLANGAYALVLLEAIGEEKDVRHELDVLQRLGRVVGRGALTTRDPTAVDRLWSLRHAASPTIAREADRGRISVQFIEDCVVPPERLGAFLIGLQGILDASSFDAVIFGHAGDGNVHVNPLVDVRASDWRGRVRRVLDETTELVASLGGTLAGEHGDGRLRAPLLQRIWSEPVVRAFRTVKETLDPRGIMNPGVILPEAEQDPLDHLHPRREAYPPRDGP